MECSFIHANLFNYQDRLLPDREYKAFEEHLLTCRECATLVSEFASVEAIMEEKKSQEPNPFVATRILQRMETELERDPVKAKPLFQRVLQPVSFSLLLIVAVFIGFMLVKPLEAKLAGELRYRDFELMKSGLTVPEITGEDEPFFTNN